MGASQPLGRKWKHRGLSGHHDYALKMHSVLSEADSLHVQLGKCFHQVDVGIAHNVLCVGVHVHPGIKSMIALA